MKFILILTMTYFDVGGLAVQEFNTKIACEKAGSSWSQKFENEHGKHEGRTFYICTPKG